MRLARKAKLPAARVVRPLSPATVERIRAGLDQRDATLVATLAYAGLRPGEALDLRWGDVLERTIVVSAPKTGRRRNVRLLRPLATDLAAWRLASGSPAQRGLVRERRRDTLDRRGVKELDTPCIPPRRARRWCGDATPYALRHSFVSLLLAEGRSVIDVAQQAGHKASLSLDTYGPVHRLRRPRPGECRGGDQSRT